MSPDPTYTWLTQGGSVGILALAVISFMRGWVVPGGTLKQAQQEHEQEASRLRQERDRALEQVYMGNEIARRALEAAERKPSA